MIAKARTHYICEICGHESQNFQIIERCEALGILEEPRIDVKEGDIVTLYEAIWRERLHGQRYLVTRVFYSTPDEEYDTFMRQIKPHTLCIELRCSLKIRGEAWEGEGGFIFHVISYRDFVLFRDGNRAELEAAGLVGALPWWKKLAQKFSRAA